MPRRRKKSPLLLTMGIISIVYGCLGIICSGCIAFSAAIAPTTAKMPAPNGGPNMIQHMNKEVPHWIEIDVARGAVVFIFSVMAIIAGIGLINRKGWSRWLTVFGSIVMILQQLAYGIYAFTTYFPAMERWQKAQGAAPGFGAGMQAGGLISMVLVLLFPLVLLVAMLLPAAGEAFRPPSRRRD